ncbi:MAG: PaaI family thioesterase [Burkholderiales bacterium]|nr:MAG: PaaI family thioesterase [Burkholderiales bacterium]
MLFGVRIPMVAALGLVGEAIEPDYARIRMPFRDDLTNSAGRLHGGALMTVLDCVLACAARSRDPAGTRVITVDMTTHFIASTCGDAIAEARCLRRGRSIAFSQGEIRDSQGRLLATATGTFKPVPRGAPGGDG